MTQFNRRFMAMLALCMLCGAFTGRANAQYCAPSVFLGDLNQDNLVNDTDRFFWQNLFNTNQYSPCADLNRNGVLDYEDKVQLTRAAKFAQFGGGGLGLQGRLPAFTISELRSGRPNPGDSQERYVEFRVPADLPSNYNFSRQFDAGYYLILVSRYNGTSLNNGVIRRVINLQGLPFAGGSATSSGLGLLIDSSFTLPIPAGFVPFALPIAETITFASQQDLNTTWLLVYRRPAGPGYNASAALPAVGQIIDRNQDCMIDNRFLPTFPSPPPPYALPPWDLILDAIAVDRSVVTTAPGGRGCIYAHGPLFEVEPVESAAGTLEAAYHVYRNADNKLLSAVFQEVTTGIDTPGKINATSAKSAFCGAESAGLCTVERETPFCSDRDCCQYVCALDPFCCELAWDLFCVVSAVDNCGACGLPGTGGCFSPHGSPNCSSPTCCANVCAVMPLCCVVTWDAECAAEALKVCLTCGEVALGSCFQVGLTPFCDDAACCNTVCEVDPSCCEFVWDASCVSHASLLCQELACGSLSTGPCCLSHGTPFCTDFICCNTVCQIDPYCCEFVWDVQCVTETLQFCTTVSCTCGGGGAEANCFEEHESPGCASVTCCNSVCNSDPFCCGIGWDASCVAAAEALCAANPLCEGALGGCFVEHASPGCSDPACCTNVCAEDPNCCNIEWDAACVALVSVVCQGCGDVFAGSCTVPHKTPACDNRICCVLVCEADPFCCEAVWDIACADQATANCLPKLDGCGDDDARSCFVASFLKGCSDPVCCAAICGTEVSGYSVDDYCCTVQWDAICVGEALTFARLGLGCHLPTGASGRGDCLEVHPEKGCSDLECSAAVCSIEPVCCTVTWDANCAEIAPYVCITTGGCPGTGSSFAVHATPGSIDPSCCQGVCVVRPECCTISWDSQCVLIANQRCRPDPDWNLPCTGSCIEAHVNPGCEDVSCGSVVCFVDALCCTAAWDQDCASLARGLCCGFPGCGNSCNGGCLVPHESPYCSDPYCCAAVCAEDPYCCETVWDSNCVKFAYQRCARGCGNSEAGSCLSGHGTPGCSDALCCSKVCTTDPFCCDTAWDSACGVAAQAEELCGTLLECGSELSQDCCSEHIGSPTCRVPACCDAVCAADPICCELGWDGTCASAARALESCDCIRPCGDLCAGDCCSDHLTPSCRDLTCCTTVCAADPYCCETAWDVTCASMARSMCAVGPESACPIPVCGEADAGDCCLPHLTAACRDLECCTSVCAMEPQCCTVIWDSTCAQVAGKTCDVCEGPTCGSPETGSCFSPQTTPYCNQAACCGLICGKVQPECCSIAWDESCVAIAQIFCNQ